MSGYGSSRNPSSSAHSPPEARTIRLNDRRSQSAGWSHKPPAASSAGTRSPSAEGLLLFPRSRLTDHSGGNPAPRHRLLERRPEQSVVAADRSGAQAPIGETVVEVVERLDRDLVEPGLAERTSAVTGSCPADARTSQSGSRLRRMLPRPDPTQTLRQVGDNVLDRFGIGDPERQPTGEKYALTWAFASALGWIRTCDARFRNHPTGVLLGLVGSGNPHICWVFRPTGPSCSGRVRSKYGTRHGTNRLAAVGCVVPSAGFRRSPRCRRVRGGGESGGR